jgi:hypothetical protein
MIPGFVPIISYIKWALYYTIFCAFITSMALPSPQKYREYKKRSKWRKKLERYILKIGTKCKNQAFEAYLYLLKVLKKREANIKKGCQKGRTWNYNCMRRIQTLLLQANIVGAAMANGSSESNSQRISHFSTAKMDEDIVMYPTVCMSADKTIKLRDKAQSLHFDDGSFELMVDNCASRSITNDINDYVTPPTPSKTQIQRINGNADATLLGTVKWSIEDDEGRIHHIILPGTYYSQHAKKKLLSPQHWAKQAGNEHPIRNGTWCATYANKIKLHWDQQRYTRTIHLNPRSNVGILRMAPTITKYCNVCKHIEEDVQILAMPTVLETFTHYEEGGNQKNTSAAANLVADSEDENEEENTEVSLPHMQDPQKVLEESREQPESEVRISPQTLDLLFEEEERDDSEGEPFTFTTKEHEYLHWHNKLGHISHTRLLQLSKNGVLPKHLSKVTPPPLCASCIYGKMTKIPWRVKGSVHSTPKVVTAPGECIAVDQLESTTPGFIGQLKGNILTKERYRYATVFVDQYSDYTYVHFHVRLTSEETVKAKHAFEAHL